MGPAGRSIPMISATACADYGIFLGTPPKRSARSFNGVVITLRSEPSLASLPHPRIDRRWNRPHVSPRHLSRKALLAKAVLGFDSTASIQERVPFARLFWKPVVFPAQASAGRRAFVGKRGARRA